MKKGRIGIFLRSLFCAACVACVVCVACIAALWAAPVMEAQASSGVTSESIREKEGQINQAKRDIKNLEKGLSDIQDLKKQLEQEKNNLKNYVTKLDQELEELEQNILDLKFQISGKETEIQETSEELEEAQITAQNQYEYMVTSIRYFYEEGTLPTMWELLFSSQGIGDFLNRLDYMNRVYEYDERMWTEYEMNCQYIALCKEQLELEKQRAMY